MLILVTANNFLQLFVGWEGVGVSSYLLISFWFTRIQANKSAIKAMLVNRVGDFALLLALFFIFYSINSLDYDIVFSTIPLLFNKKISLFFLQVPIIDLICLFLFLGAMGKSAQIGLHTWLPDAMEGPTPVSALIHAATMVTAGVFLISRCSYIFEFSPTILSFILIVGSITSFFAATTGLFQNDIKKVIAYSTCSQLGYMVFACGLSSYDVSLFHLSNHAFFKALLFLGAGSIIHSISDEQDMRKLGGLKNLLPFTYCILILGSLALTGFPFFAGFFSKDVLLEVSLSKYSLNAEIAYCLGIFSAFLTAFYSTRVVYLTFLSGTNANKNYIFNAHESAFKIQIPLLILAVLSIFIGFLTKDLFIGTGNNFWGSALFIQPSNYVLLEIEFIQPIKKLIPLIVTLHGIFFSFFLYKNNIFSYYFIKKTLGFKFFYTFFNKKWYIDRIYNQFVNQNLLLISYDFFYTAVDRGLLERVGPSEITKKIKLLLKTSLFIQSGYLLDYLAYFVFFILTSVFFFIFVSFNL
jgi:NADH-ubiquinone oxidoreductase chain 5